jgi:hypothetical protein
MGAARYPTPFWIDQLWLMDEEGKIRAGAGLWPGNYSDIFRYSDELEEELSALISKTRPIEDNSSSPHQP